MFYQEALTHQDGHFDAIRIPDVVARNEGALAKAEETAHHGPNGFLLFGGLAAGLGWILFIVWYSLVSLADLMR